MTVQKVTKLSEYEKIVYDNLSKYLRHPGLSGSLLLCPISNIETTMSKITKKEKPMTILGIMIVIAPG